MKTDWQQIREKIREIHALLTALERAIAAKKTGASMPEGFEELFGRSFKSR